MSEPEPGELWVCDESLPLDRKYPEFEDTDLVRLEFPRNGECPMCAEDLDSLFWEAFLDKVEQYGLASDEDPACVNDGYAIEVACRLDDGASDTCRYEAYLVSHCELAPERIP